MNYAEKQLVAAQVAAAQKIYLKPCPFCGQIPDISYFTGIVGYGYGITQWQIECSTDGCINCYLQSDVHDGHSDAIGEFKEIAARWNKRAT